MRLRDVRLSALIPRKSFTPALAAVAIVASVATPFLATSAAAAATTDSAADGTAHVLTTIQPASIQLAAQRPVDRDAAFYANLARGTMQQADAAKVDTRQLGIQIAQLSQSANLPELTVTAFIGQLRTTTSDVAAQVADAEAKAAHARAVAAAKAKAAAAKAKAAAAAAARLAVTNTPDGARAAAQSIMASTYGWGAGQFSCLNSLWNKESGWNYKAYNANGGATGIPQALPGSKMAAAGSDWATNATTQVKWGLSYIAASYGSPCAAWGHSQAMNWY
ncbi:aggregation-promoting factor C-terminal-like domain-containing protein [Microbacterium mangrovi]|uniref:aggregation-promoting factor C-terminal-like domain-containing protein n=1 Tax=Microbacterium mangrovi TaxID=1348253 RepID=UPI00068A97BF|nr:hypothetical protein [Microbacterium mangrovi]